MSYPDAAEIHTVSRLNRKVQSRLNECFPLLIWVEGELTNLSRPASGHWYFTLKDEYAQVRCAMFRNRNMILRFSPSNGLHVLVQARISLYEPRGEFQLAIEHLEPAGEGVLQRAFEALKRKLAAEGLFDLSRKKPLPAFPRCLGVITSPTGAALQDILNVLKRRFPPLTVRLYSTSVQGEGASAQIVGAIAAANRDRACDVLVLARGGGSLEDLLPFNDESVARAIAGSRIAIVSGLGHETDFTIADFVADLRAPTPSAAAELISPDGPLLLARIREMESVLHRCMARSLLDLRQRLGWLSGRLGLQHPHQRLLRDIQRVDELQLRATRALLMRVAGLRTVVGQLLVRAQHRSPERQVFALHTRFMALTQKLDTLALARLLKERHRLDCIRSALQAVSPFATLDRGYALVLRSRDRQLLRVSTDVSPGEIIDIRLSRGGMLGVVSEVLPPDAGQGTAGIRGVVGKREQES
jgi:exodeoxyribonuclease VII large subunit